MLKLTGAPGEVQHWQTSAHTRCRQSNDWETSAAALILRACRRNRSDNVHWPPSLWSYADRKRYTQNVVPAHGWLSVPTEKRHRQRCSHKTRTGARYSR